MRGTKAMQKSSLTKIAELLSASAILAVVFFVPIFFALFLKTANVFELNKMALFRILVLIILWTLALRFVLHFRKQKLFLKSYIADNKWLFFLFLFFFLSLVFSTIISIDHRLSFFGTNDRQEGLLGYFYYFLFFGAIFLELLMRPNLKHKILGAILSSSVFVSGYGLLQAFGKDPLKWSESTEARATSTFGQPNNLGSYLIFTIPLTVYFFLKTKSKILKILLSLLIVSQIAVLYYTHSASSWLGLVVGAAVMGITALLIKLKESNKLRLQGRSIPAILFLLFFLFISITPMALSTSDSIKASQIYSGSTAARLQFWHAAWEGIKERPLLGYGLESQQEVLVKFYQPDWAIYSNVNVQESRAHNFVLDILLTQGIVGLLMQFLLWGYIFWVVVSNIKNNRKKLLNYFILSALAGYFAYLQFNFPHVTTWIYFWTLAAIAMLSQTTDSSENSAITAQENSGEHTESVLSKKSLLLKFVFIFLCFSIFSFCIFYQVKKEFSTIAVDNYFLEMQQGNAQNRYMAVVDEYDMIKKESNPTDFYDKQFVQIMYFWSRGFNNKYFYKMLNVFYRPILQKIKTDNFTDLVAKAVVYSSLGNEDEAYYKNAEEACRKLIAMSPDMPMVYGLYGDYFNTRGEYEKAIENYLLAVSKVPDLNSKGFNLLHKNVARQEIKNFYEMIGKIYEKRRDVGGKEEYEKKVGALE